MEGFRSQELRAENRISSRRSQPFWLLNPDSSCIVPPATFFPSAGTTSALRRAVLLSLTLIIP